jgi:hypothetical protein
MRPLNLGICSSIATWSHAVAVEANPITPPLRLTSTDISVDAEDTVTACSAVSASWASQIKATPTPTVNAKLAHRCLKSVPLDKSGALKFIVEIEPYLEWHSTLAFLKKPPADYFFLSHDVFAALNVIKEKLEADSYGNEYDWQEDLFTKVFSPAHDGNFYVYPDILTNAVEWARPFALVSISEDGSSPPVIKAYDDIISSPHTASTVLFINGIDAETFIEDLAIRSSGYQDADAAYNAMFWTKATAAAKSTGDFHHGGRTRYLYPGEFTSFVFENDSFTELPNVARLKGDWTGVVDGRTFLSRFGPGMDDSSLISTTTAHNTKPLTTTKTAVLGIATSLAGYPQPVIIDKKSSVSGYYIEQPGFEDIAVLVLHSFGSWTPADFQNVVQSFFDAVVDANKTKLVIDVQVNSGGYVLQGYDT